jgi:hypothetical protein
MSETLASYVDIERRFLRSIRIDADYGREDALDGYVCQKTAVRTIEAMSNQIAESQQRAFTWTGPFGGGKSSLALLLCSLVSPEEKIYKRAQRVLGLPTDHPLYNVFSRRKGGWTVLPIVGTSGSIIDALAETLDQAKDISFDASHKDPKSIIQALVSRSESLNCDGVLVVIDELGKFLESAAKSGEDIYFYQELSEAASRSKGTLIIVGILHQAFEQYAHQLDKKSQEEWAKIQGRFVDIPLITSTDETIELLTGSIVLKKTISHAKTRIISDAVASSITRRRKNTLIGLNEKLDKCWPLHPITAALLGPISKRKFSQNERTLFATLSSAEPYGFQDFLQEQHASPFSLYSPWHYWDYLRANLEPSILLSPDGHRWALAAEVVDRAASRGESIHVKITKTVALLDIFKNSSSLYPDNDLLFVAFPETTKREVERALSDLSKWSILLYRKYIDSWGIYAGSDFDIDEAINRAKIASGEFVFSDLIDSKEFFPILAKRHYQTTGTMRLFGKSVVFYKDVRRYLESLKERESSTGEFLLIVPESSATLVRSEEAKTFSEFLENEPIVFAISDQYSIIGDLMLELGALKHIQESDVALAGDSVARKEISARLYSVKTRLNGLIDEAFMNSHWHWNGKEIPRGKNKSLSFIASQVCDEIFSEAPHIHNELINRHKLSVNVVKARRELMYRMLKDENKENLGFVGYPAEASLYYSLLHETTIHREVNGVWGFYTPLMQGKGETFQDLFRMTTERISQSFEKMTSLADVFTLWDAPPLGIRSGVMPILALAYFLANRNSLALYMEGVFTPELTEVVVDEWLQDPSRVSFRYVDIDPTRERFLEEISSLAAKYLGKNILPTPLEAAIGLVSFSLRLPGWTRRTKSLRKETQQIRDLLLKASDPYRVLFIDIPQVMASISQKELLQCLSESLEELKQAYPTRLKSLEEKLFMALDHKQDLQKLHERAVTVKGISGDFLLDSFATRLSTYIGDQRDLEGLVSLAINKPPRDWGDTDIDAAILQIGKWAMEFRRVEALAYLQNRTSTRRAFAVAFGASNNRSSSTVIDISNDESEALQEVVSNLRKTISNTKNIRNHVILAALAEVGVQLLDQPSSQEEI